MCSGKKGRVRKSGPSELRCQSAAFQGIRLIGEVHWRGRAKKADRSPPSRFGGERALSLALNPMLSRLPGVACLAAFAPCVHCKFAITREAAVFKGYVLPALAARLSGKLAVLAEAPLSIWHALPTLGRDGALFRGVHRGEATLRSRACFLWVWETIITPILRF